MNYKIYVLGMFIFIFIIDIFFEDFAVVAYVIGWLIGLITMSQWNEKKEREDVIGGEV